MKFLNQLGDFLKFVFMNIDHCPCGRQKPYPNCCGAVHKDIRNAKTAEDLMRSRYSAFTLAMGDYLIKSHHPKTRSSVQKNELEEWAKSVKWLFLDVLNTKKGLAEDTQGEVEFVAHFKKGMFNKKIEENSRFLKEDGIWYYLDAI